MNRRATITLFFAGAILLLLATPHLFAQGPAEVDLLNMEVLGHIEPITNKDAGGLHNSCWGYVAPDGHEYGLFGTQVGTYIIDLDARPIREVTFIQGPVSTWRNIKTYGEVAYISTENRAVDQGAGLQIVDLSNLPDSAHLVRTDTVLMLSAHTLWMADGYLYALGTRAEVGLNGGALILDVATDPLNPVRAGGVSERYYHDAFVRNDTLVGAAINDGGADLVDVSDKENPVMLGRITYPFAGTHNTALTSGGGYALTSDEIGFTRKTLKVWDIGDVDEPVLVAEYTPNLEETIHNVRVRGRYAFVAWYTAGVRVIDMIDPTHPREVGYADTYPGPSGGFDGTWEVYPLLPSGRIIASDRNSGLYLLGFNNATAGSVSGTLRDRESGDLIPEIEVTLEGVSESGESAKNGRYYVGGIDGEIVTFTISAYGYRDTTLTVELQGEMTLDLELTPRPFGQLRVTVVDAGSDDPLPGFSWAVDGLLESRVSSTPTVIFDLPLGVDYTLIAGRWGHRAERRSIRLEEEVTELTIALRQGYLDDATLDLGWSRGEGDNAITGVWNRIEPYLGYPRSDWIHPKREPSGLNGWIFFTGHPPLFAPPDRDDVSGGASSLVSPAMDLRAYNDPIIILDRWFVHFEKDTIIDALTIDLSEDGGATWREAWREVKGKAGWKRVLITPADLIRLTDQVHLRLRVTDTLGNILVVAGMDNFEVLGRESSGVGDSSPEIAIPAYVHHRQLHVRMEPGDHTVELYTVLGERVARLFDGRSRGESIVLDPPGDLSSGLYLFHISSPDRTYSLQLVIP